MGSLQGCVARRAGYTVSCGAHLRIVQDVLKLHRALARAVPEIVRGGKSTCHDQACCVRIRKALEAATYVSTDFGASTHRTIRASPANFITSPPHAAVILIICQGKGDGNGNIQGRCGYYVNVCGYYRKHVCGHRAGVRQGSHLLKVHVDERHHLPKSFAAFFSESLVQSREARDVLEQHRSGLRTSYAA